MFSVLVTYTYSFRRKEDILYFARVPVVGDSIVLDVGMFKVIEVRLYTFTQEKKEYEGLVAHIITEEA